MSVQLARIYGILIGALAIVGLFVNGHLFLIMNTDIALDLLRVVLAAYLLYVGFAERANHLADGALEIVGVLYVVMGIAGLFAPTLGGILPSGLTGFDIVFHLATGALAVAVGTRHQQRRAAAH